MRLLSFAPTLLGLTGSLLAQNGGRGGQPTALTLTIPGFPDGGQIPVKFSQAAAGVAPGEGTSVSAGAKIPIVPVENSPTPRGA